ncbi:MAG: NMD3-related protein, partial [Candidatus Heimdallarchaeaceae archaeon]
LVRTNCDECTKYKSGYFEAILQVRGDNRKLTEKEVFEIEELIEKIMNQYEDAKMSYIMDLTADQDGITAQISTKYLAESIAKEIKAQTSGKMSVAYEHKTTSRDGTEVYTNTYLVRLPEYAEGDIIEYEKILWVVKGVSDQQIKVESLEDHEIKKFDRKRIEDKGRKRNEEIVEREYMIVSIEKNGVVIMALDNYENYDDILERLPRNKRAGENIKGFIIEDRNYYTE